MAGVMGQDNTGPGKFWIGEPSRAVRVLSWAGKALACFKTAPLAKKGRKQRKGRSGIASEETTVTGGRP